MRTWEAHQAHRPVGRIRRKLASMLEKALPGVLVKKKPNSRDAMTVALSKMNASELLEQRNAQSREADAKLVKDKEKWRKAHDVAMRAVFSAAEGGNVICVEARREILRILRK